MTEQQRSTAVRRVLVTGAAGFAGSHLLDLLAVDPGIDVVAWRRPGENTPSTDAARRAHWVALDLRDQADVTCAMADADADVVYHLAGAAHVGAAWTKTAETLAVNVLGTHHVIWAAARSAAPPRVFIPSSAYVYQPSATAIGEDAPVHPDTPYGLSKLAQEMVGWRAWSAAGIPVVVARAFNHVGPRQDPSFSTSSFARQIATIEAGLADPVLLVGNLSARRDLTDVRDTVRAYRAIAEHGQPGRIYNVCSGVAHTVGDVLTGLLRGARVHIDVRVDPARLRPNDTPIVLGDSGRLQRELGWQPNIPLDETLSSLLDYWRGAVRPT